MRRCAQCWLSNVQAARLCRGRGRAVSEGSLEVNQVPGRADRVSISEIYTCTGSAGS